jgi:cytochrome c oxidase subunit 4
MAGANITPEQERHVESHAPYMKVFWALLVLTILEYGYARFMEGRISFVSLVAGLMILALTKAFLVGWFFMHLKFEGRWVYFMLVPVCFLAAAVVTGLAPDMAFHQLGFYESPAVSEH